MDHNGMTAIISVIMIGLGFINGMIVSTLLDKAEVCTLHCQLLKEKQTSTRLQDTIDDLEEDIVDLKAEKERILRSIAEIVHQSRHLPAPQGPLERSTVEPDSEDEEFECPISPEPNPACMG
jgi:hypothetical protein